VQVHTNHRERSPLSALQRLNQFQTCRREVFPVNIGTPGRNGLAARSAERDDATESHRRSICRLSSFNFAGACRNCETPREEQFETGRHHEKTRSPLPPCAGRLGPEGAGEPPASGGTRGALHAASQRLVSRVLASSFCGAAGVELGFGLGR